MRLPPLRGQTRRYNILYKYYIITYNYNLIEETLKKKYLLEMCLAIIEKSKNYLVERKN